MKIMNRFFDERKKRKKKSLSSACEKRALEFETHDSKNAEGTGEDAT